MKKTFPLRIITIKVKPPELFCCFPYGALFSLNSFCRLDVYVILSIVIPAYNEERRLPIMLDAASAYTDEHRESVLLACRTALNPTKKIEISTCCIEWLVVNDGSKDETANVVREYVARRSSKEKDGDAYKLVSLRTNGGKGAAVKAGMMRARGVIRLMADADGATDFGPGLERVLKNLSAPVVFGSRAHLEERAAAQRSWIRTALMYAFHFFVQILCHSHVKDTQCGFKLFTHDAAMQLFGNLHLRRWAFDTELVVLAHYLGIDIVEVAVPWQEVDGSKLDTSKLALALASVSMLRDMICVRACYTLGIWKVKKQ